ncbi:hypothetical protein ABEG17_03040 [Pedococcus sp. KACC 23699]|uniref:Uncharacterized protein n=1 Tax=Pedococcus sp. KACC 23699 TaxID=3149228 RepID=A0AAU7JVP2_9MICO
MSEPSTHIPGDVADAQVDESAEAAPANEAEEKIELDLDEEKIEAWDEVKSDYQVDPYNQQDRLPGADEDGVDEGRSMQG